MADETDNSGASESVQELVDGLAARAEARGDSLRGALGAERAYPGGRAGGRRRHRSCTTCCRSAGSTCATTAAATASSRPSMPTTTWPMRTTDAMSLFLQEVRRYPLLTRGEEVELAKRIERGDLEAKSQLVELEPAAGDLQRAQVPGSRAAAARPDPGGDPRVDPRGREVRLAQGLQVLDLRDVLDPPGDPAGAGQPRPHDSGSRSTSGSGSARSPAPTASYLPSSGREPSDEELAQAAEITLERAPGGARRLPRRHQPRPAGRRGGGHLARRRCWPATRGGPTRRSRSSCARTH